VSDRAAALSALRDSGFLHPLSVATQLSAATWWGPGTAALYSAAAQRHPNRTAIIDNTTSITYRQLDRRTNRMTRGMRAMGVGHREAIGILCRNHIAFVVAHLVGSKLGAPVVYLNTGFAPRQLEDVIEREGIGCLIHDKEFGAIAARLDGVTTVVADDDAARPSLHFVARDRSSVPPMRPSSISLPVLMTSGTTGTPKGARRADVTPDLVAGTALFQKMPYRRGDRFVIAAPLFHAWGLSQLTLAAAVAGTVIVQPRFDPLETLDTVLAHKAQVLVVVPIMLSRMLAVAEPKHRFPQLQITATSGSAVSGDLASRWMNRFGLNLYNLYGSTEVGQATLATPMDLRRHPGTAGSVLAGTTVRVLDGRGVAAAGGEVGEIHVGSPMAFDGYTGGGTKPSIDGLLSIGDVGFFNTTGQLFVTGRADDMIVSGGENVFPQEIEDLLNSHDGVVEAAVHGVADDEFGQRLRAVVVLADPGLEAEDLRHHVSSELARFKVPRDFVFVEELPRNATGKLLRRSLVDII
jgi:acyl-CoA synthetase (AMP-forming)/AMP-acid ligase II